MPSLLPEGVKSLGQIAAERGGRLTEREAVTYVRRAAEVVEHLHRSGRSHGAINEAAIGLDGQGQIVLSPVVTPAPDYETSRDADTRALAHLLYRLLAGRAPHAHETQWPGSLAVANALQKALWSRTENPPSLPAWVAQLVPTSSVANSAVAAAQSTLGGFGGRSMGPTLAAPPSAVPLSPALNPAVLPTAAPIAVPVVERPRPTPAAVPSLPPVSSTPLPSVSWNEPVLVRRIAASNGRFVRVAWAADGEIWSATENGVAQIWSVRTGACAANLPMHARSGAVTCVAFGFNASGAVANSGAGAGSGGDAMVASGHEDGAVRLWDARGNRLRRTFPAHTGRVSALALALHPAGSRLASGGGDGALLWWDVDAGQQANELAESSLNIRVLSASPDGARLAAGGDGGRLEVWNARSGQKTWSSIEHEFWLTALAFATDGKMLASGAYDRTIRLWMADNGAPLQTLNGHEALINALHFSPRGRLLVSASADGSARLWDTWTGESGPVLRGWSGGANGVAFSPGGRFLAVAADDCLTVWKFES